MDTTPIATIMMADLEKLGISASVTQMTGDNAFPVEYRLGYGDILVVGPTIELAMLALLANLVRTPRTREPEA